MADSMILKNLFSIELEAERYDWKPFKDGIDIYNIYGDDNGGPAAALLRYQSGARVPLHLHQGYEHILVLSGSQTDGSNVFKRGTLLVSTPGSRHRVASEDGCIVLAIWQSPVKFLES